MPKTSSNRGIRWPCPLFVLTRPTSNPRSFSKEVFALVQSSFETSMNAAKAFMGVKTLREAIDLQADLSRSQFDRLMADSTKLAEMSVKVANEAFQPIQARVNVAIEKMLKPVAA